jgi:hypothetical protein
MYRNEQLEVELYGLEEVNSVTNQVTKCESIGLKTPQRSFLVTVTTSQNVTRNI